MSALYSAASGSASLTPAVVGLGGAAALAVPGTIAERTATGGASDRVNGGAT